MTSATREARAGVGSSRATINTNSTNRPTHRARAAWVWSGLAGALAQSGKERGTGPAIGWGWCMVVKEGRNVNSDTASAIVYPGLDAKHTQASEPDWSVRQPKGMPLRLTVRTGFESL